MKKLTAASLLALALIPAFAEDYLENPIAVTMTSVRQESRTQDLVVDYTLANHPGIVRMDVLTNGVSIGAEHFATFTGDYSATEADVVQPGAHTFRWRARKDWLGNLASNAVVRLSAYYTNQIDQIPGVYMRVDLNDGQSASSYPVAYTFAGPSTDDDGHANDTADMDRYLWLRRVGSSGPATYTQGSTTYGSLIDNAGTAETKRQVTLSEGFFAGVFPVTQAQYVRVIAKNNSSQNGGDYAPVNYVSYEDIRGSVSTDSVDWPSTGHDKVGASSFLYALRSRTGLEFDLPTEAQWEFLCRAGTDTDFNDGSNLSPTNYYIGTTLVQNTQYDEHLAELGWFGKSTAVGTGNATGAKQVGQKNPNAWGLYDCHGNVWERCLDWSANLTTSSATDPEGASSGSARVLRGGCWDSPAVDCRSALRDSQAPSGRSRSIGFRLVCAFQ